MCFGNQDIDELLMYGKEVICTLLHETVFQPKPRIAFNHAVNLDVDLSERLIEA